MDEKRLAEIERNIDFTRDGVEHLNGADAHKLVAEVRRLRALAKFARAMLATRSAEDLQRGHGFMNVVSCLVCGIVRPDGHTPGCAWLAFMRATEGLA